MAAVLPLAVVVCPWGKGGEAEGQGIGEGAEFVGGGRVFVGSAEGEDFRAVGRVGVV